MSVVCWCASLGFMKLQQRRIFVPSEAEDEKLSKWLANIQDYPMPANHIWGICRISFDQAYSFMNIYGQADRLQLDFWRNLFDDELDTVYRFKVTSAAKLPQPVPLLQCGDRKLRGFVVDLEAGQAANLWEMLPAEARQLLGQAPEVAVRLPPQHALLTVLGHWTSVFLPERPWIGTRGGSSAVSIKWSLLGLRQPDPNGLDHDEDLLKTRPVLSGEVCCQIADVLRKFAHSVDQGNDYGEAEYAMLKQHVFVLETMYTQLQPTHFAKMVKDMRNKASISQLLSSDKVAMKYNTTFLLKTFVLSDCLRNSWELAMALESAFSMILPDVFQNILHESILAAAHIVPHASTISRWRLLLDGALMMWHRNQNLESGGQFARYMMTDSSTQHGRTFQVTCIQSIACSDLVYCFLDINDLINMWRPTWFHIQ